MYNNVAEERNSNTYNALYVLNNVVYFLSSWKNKKNIFRVSKYRELFFNRTRKGHYDLQLFFLTTFTQL